LSKLLSQGIGLQAKRDAVVILLDGGMAALSKLHGQRIALQAKWLQDGCNIFVMMLNGGDFV
jgi:hypothetical protein